MVVETATDLHVVPLRRPGSPAAPPEESMRFSASFSGDDALADRCVHDARLLDAESDFYRP